MNETRFETTLDPIGIFYCSRQFPYDAPRQGNLTQTEEIGTIRLEPGRNFEQATRELENFDRIWLIYAFDRNLNWKPIVRPPRANAPRVGVFASRSPYRPNPLGLSCVELVQIAGLDITVRGFDLLNETPVYDIKPYLPYADSFPEAGAGWTADLDRHAKIYEIQIEEAAREKIDWLKSVAQLDLERFLEVQLREDPDDDSRKRLTRPDPTDPLQAARILAYRTFRIHFRLPLNDLSPPIICVDDIRSAYTAEELENSNTADPYGDLKTHRRFRDAFL